MSGAAPLPGAADQSHIQLALAAGEESGDRLGSALMQALSKQTGGRATFFGVGGQAMAAAGMPSLFPIDELGIIGFSAIPRRFFPIMKRIREAADAIVAARPDVLVIIDSPEFTHRVARRVRAAAPDIPIVNYVSPSVWAWRPGRARAMRGYVDCVLALLPFEPDAHMRLGGPPCVYVGHPLTEIVDQLRPNAEEAGRRNTAPPVLVVLPGSRRGEIERLLPIFGAAIALLKQRFGEFELVLPTVPRLESAVRAGTAGWAVPPRIVVELHARWAAFRTARAALAKSGTVTLELALAGVPMAAAYKVPWWEGVIGGMIINSPSIILANLVIGENVVPEFFQEDCTPERLAAALLPLLRDSSQRDAQIGAFAKLDAIMEIGTAQPSERAAAAVLDLVKFRSQPARG